MRDELVAGVQTCAVPISCSWVAFRPLMEVALSDERLVVEIAPSCVAVKPPIWVVVISPKSDRKSTRLNSSHQITSYAVFCLKNCMTVQAQGCVADTAPT